MGENRKKLIQLRTKLEFYTKLDKKIEKVLNAELELEDWASEVYVKRNQLRSELDDLKMEITKEQIKELIKIAQAIDNENRIDGDVTGGYVEEPYNSIIERIYAIVNECEGKNVDAGENTLPIQHVSNSLLSLDGKTIPVTFHVSKFEPKIDIDLSNDC